MQVLFYSASIFNTFNYIELWCQKVISDPTEHCYIVIKLFFWPQFKKNTSITKDSVNPFFKRKISVTSKRQCSYNESLLYIPRIADTIKYSALIQWLKTSEVTDKIWWKIGLSFFFVTVRPSLTNACDLAVLNVADINVFYTAQRTICYDEFKEKEFFFYFADNENSSYKLSAVNNHFSPVTKWRRHRFWYLIEFEQFMRIFKNGGMEWHSGFTVFQYRMRISR